LAVQFYLYVHDGPGRPDVMKIGEDLEVDPSNIRRALGKLGLVVTRPRRPTMRTENEPSVRTGEDPRSVQRRTHDAYISAPKDQPKKSSSRRGQLRVRLRRAADRPAELGEPTDEQLASLLRFYGFHPEMDTARDLIVGVLMAKNVTRSWLGSTLRSLQRPPRAMPSTEKRKYLEARLGQLVLMRRDQANISSDVRPDELRIGS
jgi:hypothetical protein